TAEAPTLATDRGPASWRRCVAATVLVTVVPALVIGPLWGVAGVGLGAVCCLLLRRPRLLGLAGVVVAIAVGTVVLYRFKSQHPVPGPLFPGYFEDLHGLGLFTVTALLATLVAGDHPPAPSEPEPSESGDVVSAGTGPADPSG